MERVTKVRPIGPYAIEVTFDDGFRRQIDLEGELWGPVFEPLRDPAVFARVDVDHELGTIVWPNGADLAPEFLYYGEEEPPPGYYEAGEETEDDLEEAVPVVVESR